MFITSFEEQNITYRSCSNLRQSKAPTEPPIDLKKLHAKIGEQALEIDFLEGVLKKLGRFNHKS
ncbi:hypothetical protein T630_3545 [Acinetobacter baumannii MRSN 3527]|uniref:Uncharacterized protein n=1 Tax=Acinetobacter baumannii MRSN 3527 TaxID=1409923 RepID=A0A0J1AC76_ACIBA|nr:hypothetical protein T630_3545 [Acinetobacter baumannii MRSN 3527]